MNKDIIVEELKDWLLPDVENLTLTGKEEELVEDIKVVAKSILAKLDTISEDQILNLTPEPSEIIAEGEVNTDQFDDLLIGNENFAEIEDCIRDKYWKENIKIKIIKESK